jgi:branched-chain amino acid transport system substrate-binding protein
VSSLRWSKAMPIIPRILLQSCSPLNSRVPMSWAPIWAFRLIRLFLPGSCVNWASISPGSASPTTVVTSVLELAGPALYGSYAVADFAADSSPAAKEFATKYEATYKSAPDFHGAWTYDAVHVLALAINNAKSLEPQKIREAILSVKSYQGAEGTYNFDQNGDGLRGYNVVKNDNGKIVFIKHVDFSE